MVRFLVMIALFAFASAELRRIPMKKTQNHILSVDNIRVERNHLMEKHHSTVQDDTQECVVNMDHTIKNRFYAQIPVGTPSQLINAVFDTSAYVAYICATCSGYNYKESSTAKLIQTDGVMEIDYLDNTSYSNNTFVEDIFNIGGVNAQVKFAVNDIVFDNVDMVFGLSLQNKEYLLPPLYYMYQELLLENLEYSLYYDNNNDSDFGGHLILGGIDSSAYSGSLTPISFPGYDYTITVTIDSFSINGIVTGSNTLAYLESGSNFIGVPLLTFARISEQINGIVDDEGNYYVDCDTVDSLPDVLLEIGGNVYTITPQNYILSVSNGLTPCMSAFTYLNLPVFNLGQPFLTSVYTYVNLKNQTVGFANLA